MSVDARQENNRRRDRRARRLGEAFGVVLILLAAAWNLRSAARIAAVEGKTLGDIFRVWWGGYAPRALYSGTTLLAIDRIEVSLLLVTVLVIWAVHAYSIRAVEKRARENH